jgi:hypothetical protein
MYRIVTALLFLVATTVGTLAQSLPVPSFWQNQRGSYMKLYSMDAQGHFIGVYMNNAEGFKCRYSPFNPPYQVTGKAHGAKVRFTVVWDNGVQNCNSTTVWHGLLNGKTLATVWILTGKGMPPIFGRDVFQQLP